MLLNFTIAALVLHTVKMHLYHSNFDDIMFWPACCCVKFIPPFSGFSSHINVPSDTIVDKVQFKTKYFCVYGIQKPINSARAALLYWAGRILRYAPLPLL